ncbi:MAG: hypothetical protein WC011_02135 [Candidatus Paceibacterota bacterium]
MSSNIKSEPVLDFFVEVDRSQKPIYPVFLEKVIHPEFELTGPDKFDLQNDVNLWCHEYQVQGIVRGHSIYDELKEDDLLKDCLNLADLFGLQQKGIKVFQYLYKGKRVFGWKSVILTCLGELYAPCLDEYDSNINFDWVHVKEYWFYDCPALIFRK